MARTYPVLSPFAPAPGYPWTTRTRPTGTPLTGTRQQDVLTLTGTPQPGRTEDQTVTAVGTFAAGGVATLTLDGTPYAYTVLLGDTPTDVAAGLAALAVADPNYTVTSAGPVVDVLSQTSGPWTGTITCGYTPAGSEDGTLEQAVVTIGADANRYAVTDGTNTYTYTVQIGDTLADCAIGLAAAIDAAVAYVASAHGTQVWADRANGAAFTFTDASTNNITPGGAVVVQVVTPATSGPLTLADPGVMRLTNISAVAVWCQLLAGTSFVVVPWIYNANIQVWHALAGTTVSAATEVILLDVGAVDAMFVEIKTLLGGAQASVYVDGNRLTPGFSN